MARSARPRPVMVEAFDRKAIGAFIADARARAGITQRQLEIASRVSQGKISRMERGSSRPLLSEIVDVCAALGVRVRLEMAPDQDAGPTV